MKTKTFEVPAAPGKFSATEEAILTYLYTHPEEIGAKGLARILKPEEQESWKDIEEGIKTLIAAGLAKVSRLSWNWRKRSSVKITERTYEEGTEAFRTRRKSSHPEAASCGQSTRLGAV